MKSSMTMFKLCRQRAILNGPRHIGEGYGYGLTVDEAKSVFFQNGFSLRGQTFSNFTTEWTLYGAVEFDKVAEVYWFPVSLYHIEMLKARAKADGIPESEWKVMESDVA